MQETALYARWLQLAQSGQKINNADSSLQILKPGALNTAKGPDFKAARFKLNGVIYQGDVECHIDVNDWYLHQHHLDPAFANVVLHIISKNHKNRCTVKHLVSGIKIPNFILANFSKEPKFKGCLIDDCHYSTLTKLAEQRLNLKIRMFYNTLSLISPQQVFYEFLFRALGYSANAHIFQLLAKRLPWSWLNQKKTQALSAQELFALYSGQAGFLSNNTASAHLQELRAINQFYKSFSDQAALSEEQWQFAAVRPLNHPHFRLAGWIALYFTYQKQLLEPLIELCSQRPVFEQLYTQLKSFFKVPCSPYWQEHYAIDGLHKNQKAHFYFGNARIQEIIINLIIPLFSALAYQNLSFGFAEYLKAFYHWLPTVNAYQNIGQNLKIKQKKLPALAYYQGLFYLNHYYCQQAGCGFCSLRT